MMWRLITSESEIASFRWASHCAFGSHRNGATRAGRTWASVSGTVAESGTWSGRTVDEDFATVTGVAVEVGRRRGVERKRPMDEGGGGGLLEMWW